MFYYERVFSYELEEDWGFSFPCDENGNVKKLEMCPEAVSNYESCLTGVVRGKKVIDRGVMKQEYKEVDACSCGSGKERRELTDARGIFCCFVCDSCEKGKRNKFKPEIFEDSNYLVEENESIEPEPEIM